jgi:uncharacterized protein YcbX
MLLQPDSRSPVATISALYVYPVKSCRGIAVDSARITETGFEHDREWLIVDKDWRFMTQRAEPRLALIETTLRDSSLELTAPDAGSIDVPFNSAGESVEVTCWRDQCAAIDEGDVAARWLSSFLGDTYRLVRFDSRRPRLSNSAWTGAVAAKNQFTDGYPWLVLSRASLDDLNSRLPKRLPMNRFRPNIVFDGMGAYEEDRTAEFQIGEAKFRVVKPCDRCAITTTDQQTGTRDGDEPLRTLKSYRFDRELKGVLFGQNAILLSGEGKTLKVGDEVQLTSRSS